ncbi:glutathione S-transferase T3-like [Humulus lupulus]|uniref:glutathione S-transferase T3-like n=1 Tax=Humulus lupulus TaxID=3486 RepID=UPI002B4149E2|nr:glutathione S-transferase T3-like [Humulus lupulus]
MKKKEPHETLARLQILEETSNAKVKNYSEYRLAKSNVVTQERGLENAVLHNEDESRHKGKVKWSKEVTILLISGWLNTSKDAIVGNDQTSTHFWAQIVEYYNTYQKGEQARTGRQCKDHWNKMNQKVACFNGCYKRVQQTYHSGWHDEKILENAHQLYKSKNNISNFLLVDCWRLLKGETKWNTMYQPKGGKRTKVSESGTFTSSSNADISDDEIHEVRPTGQKAAKRKKKEKKDTHTRFIEISERKASTLEKLVAIKEKETKDNRMTKYMNYLIMDCHI